MQQRFPLGFWNYVDAADQDSDGGGRLGRLRDDLDHEPEL